MQTQAQFLTLRNHLQETIVGQQSLLDRLMVALLCGGHVLLEGLPGLAKTTAVNALAAGVHASFQRIQFTPDLMPADLTGSDIFDPEQHGFRFVAGPLFHEIVLADEINRAPPKVQSALLEAMAEHQITVGGVTRELPELFIVMATQNPLEQSGTYPLPEAQLDRFLLHVVLDYPSGEDELEILRRDRRRHFAEKRPTLDSPLQPATVLAARQEVAEVHVEPLLEEYIVELVGCTRSPERIDPHWAGFLQAGASPRASLALLRAASGMAYLQGREYVIPEDIIEVAPDVLRHRLVLDYAAQAAGVDADAIIRRILDFVPVP
ncbi:MAG: AAA family ATPase [Pseudomonadota bacterium]